MLIATIPVLMIVLGALVYALSANPKLVELGRLCAFAGLIGVAVASAGRLLTVLGR